MFLHYFLKRIVSIKPIKWLEILTLWFFIFLFGISLYSLLFNLLLNSAPGFDSSLVTYAILTLLLLVSWHLGVAYRDYISLEKFNKLTERTHIGIDETNNMTIKEFISKRHIKGQGIEIGALHNPLKVFGETKVKYVDRLPVQDLRRHYPELNGLPLVEADIIDDGERLEKIGDSTQDFVIANHFLEHCQNPILAMENMLRVLKKGGILYLTIPNKESSFDRLRDVTSLDHIIKDYNEGPDWSKRQHFEEWTKLVSKASNVNIGDIEGHINQLIDNDFSIHFHVWDRSSILEFINFIYKKMDITLELIILNKSEFLCLLLKD